MNVQINNSNELVIKQLDKIIEHLKQADHCIYDDTCAYDGINKASAIAETLKDLLITP